jgi:hypothetical protein
MTVGDSWVSHRPGMMDHEVGTSFSPTFGCGLFVAVKRPAISKLEKRRSDASLHTTFH